MFHSSRVLSLAGVPMHHLEVRGVLILALVCLVALVGGGCGAAPETTESAAIPPGWKDFSGGSVSIALPADWTMVDWSGGNEQAALDALKKTNPKIADFLGDLSALPNTAFFASARGATSVDNLKITREVSRSGDARISTPDEMLDLLSAQYDSLGWKVTESTGGMRIAGTPAAYISYEASVKGLDGNEAWWIGQQYLLLTDSDLWVLTYSLGLDSPALSEQLSKSSAESFRVN
jgi:hypothetical protein